MNDTAERIADLARILEDYVFIAAPAADAIERHLTRLRLDRLQRLATYTERHTDHSGDQVDGLAMRMLLHEYVTALAHLRAATQEAAAWIDAAPAAIKDVRRYVQQEVELLEKEHVSTAPSDQ